MTSRGIKQFAKWDAAGCIAIGVLDAMSKGLLVKGAAVVLSYGFVEGVVLAVYVALPVLCVVGALSVYRTLRAKPTTPAAVPAPEGE
jgi:hypothetical protein